MVWLNIIVAGVHTSCLSVAPLIHDLGFISVLLNHARSQTKSGHVCTGLMVVRIEQVQLLFSNYKCLYWLSFCF